ncbi:receptor-like protein kinase HSL1 [Diospyros lotus]|uniref:receptor-like protein kinase HSL1 n=1 Tax=Diospyros lotus TaxID=55363 RepID=UPI00224F8CE1|nr:receptor-like protein kinase HSL1 [Diospyros lotus]
MSVLPLMSPKFRHIFLSFFLTLLPFNVITQSPEADRAALLNIKQQWGNPPGTESWNGSSSPCDSQWQGINCTAGAVTGIIIRDKNIIETIPSAICDLENLTVLDLAYNCIPGSFPKVLYHCSKLQYLDLSQNCFVGPIPADVDQMSSLRYMDLGANNFTGDIPPAIGRLPELQKLHLYQNLFNGTFPAEIGDLSNLEILTMPFNEFLPSRIPPEFGKLNKLKYLWMADTNLIGPIPESFTNLSSLEHLDLSINNLSGSLPEGLFQLKNLRIVYVYKNKISGEIPTPIESLNLTQFDLSMNNLIGSIPEDLGKLQQLEFFNLNTNQLSGEVPASIGLIPTLKVFRVFTNRLNGTLPSELGLHSQLVAFEVSDNQFTGNLPGNLCAGRALLGVVAFTNNLSGEVPKSLGNCDSLVTVQLYGNNLSGEVPLGLWQVSNLSSLMLSGNSFSGELPGVLGRNLSRLEISDNRFSGKIPLGVSSWVSLVVFKASNNQLSGEIPMELTSLPQLIILMLDGNSITGELPTTIVSWKYLSTLNLAGNKIYGQIPAAIASLASLTDLNLSQNQFSGQIPPELGHLKLTTLNLSSNQLTGEIPDEFDNLAFENSFLNNSNLCANNPISNLQSCSAKSRKSSGLSSSVLAIVLALAVLLSLVTVLLTFIMVRDYRRKKLKRELAGWKLTSFKRLDFQKATILASLTENNLIGSGGSGKIYRITVNHSGDHVAVKRIWDNRNLDKKLEKEFLAEVEILGTIKHSNIVKLLCYISSEDSKLLVYEYMENQSLDKWLHGKKRRNSSLSSLTGQVVLDWPTRLQIAIGAAAGLCYMHHDCSPPIVHRDVKSSNILLDSEFKARIADFGLARILAKPGEPNTMSTLAGSIGYMAPEYAYSTKVNHKIDVYGFGVVLLELVTGRGPNDGDEQRSLAEWAWHQYQEGKSISDVLDEEIMAPFYLEAMTAVFKLGLICTSTLPSSRPTMREVLQILGQCAPLDSCKGKKDGREHDVAPLLSNSKYLSSYNVSKKFSDEDDDSLACSPA